MKKIVVSILVILLVAGVGYYFLKPFTYKAPGEKNLYTPKVDNISVSISNNAFVPASITVKKGQIVTWINNDDGQHQIIGDNLSDLSSYVMEKDFKFAYTFKNAGTFTYHCGLVPSMKGQVIVTE